MPADSALRMESSRVAKVVPANQSIVLHGKPKADTTVFVEFPAPRDWPVPQQDGPPVDTKTVVVYRPKPEYNTTTSSYDVTVGVAKDGTPGPMPPAHKHMVYFVSSSGQFKAMHITRVQTRVEVLGGKIVRAGWVIRCSETL